MKKLLSLVFAAAVAAISLALPNCLSAWQNKQYDNQTAREALPDVYAIKQELSAIEKMEMVSRLYPSSADTENQEVALESGLIVSANTKTPQDNEMELSQARTAAASELASLTQQEIVPDFGMDLVQSTVQSAFINLVDATQPARQMSVWALTFAGENGFLQLHLDSVTGKIYDLNYQGKFPLPMISYDNTVPLFAKYHGVDFDLGSGKTIFGHGDQEQTVYQAAKVPNSDLSIYFASEDMRYMLRFVSHSGTSTSLVQD